MRASRTEGCGPISNKTFLTGICIDAENAVWYATSRTTAASASAKAARSSRRLTLTAAASRACLEVRTDPLLGHRRSSGCLDESFRNARSIPRGESTWLDDEHLVTTCPPAIEERPGRLLDRASHAHPGHPCDTGETNLRYSDRTRNHPPADG